MRRKREGRRGKKNSKNTFQTTYCKGKGRGKKGGEKKKRTKDNSLETQLVSFQITFLRRIAVVSKRY